MEDYLDDLKSNYRDINARIRDLQNRLKSTRDSMGQRQVVDELGKLEQEKLEMSNLFTEDQSADVVEEEESDADAFPIIHDLWNRYPELAEQHRSQFQDVRALVLYIHFFDEEFVGLFSERKIRLDVKYSVERDSFYNLFNDLRRKLDEYLEEAQRVDEGQYAKSYEEELLRRLVEKRHRLFIEADKLFGQVNRFAGELLDDVEQDGILCQNGKDKLTYSTFDRERELRGLTVEEGLQRLYAVTEEILNYLDVPDFR